MFSFSGISQNRLLIATLKLVLLSVILDTISDLWEQWLSFYLFI